MLVYFYYLDKNPGWVTDDNVYEDYPEDYLTCASPIDIPVEFEALVESRLPSSSAFMIDLILL